MTARAMPAKSELRREVRARIAALPAGVRSERDQSLVERLLAIAGLDNGPFFAYAALADEVCLDMFVQTVVARGGVVALPRIGPDGSMAAHRIRSLADDWVPGPLGIREPKADLPVVAPEALSVVLVPGRAFDVRGGRVGRGAGYYDRYLAQTGARRIGIAYEEQVFAEVPMDARDVRMHRIVTPERVIECVETEQA